MAEIEEQIRLLADRRFARTVAAPTHRPRPAASLEGAGERPDESESVEEVTMLDVEVERPAHQSRSPRWSAIAAAVMLVAGIGAGIFFLARSDEPVTPVSAGFTVEGALEVNQAYFEAYNAGSVDSLLALFTEDATFSTNIDVDAGELRLVWSLAQGGALTPPECDVVDEIVGVAVTIACEHGTLQAPQVAVDMPVATTTEMTIVPDGISNLHETYHGRHFLEVSLPFGRWMLRDYPEDAEATSCCQGETVAESVERGEIRARYAAEWAAYQAANDCTFDEYC